jgi:hypothetical protein
MKFDQRSLLIACLPAMLVIVIFELCLGHRHDYTGHYLAGYGASLAAAMLWLRTRAAADYQKTALRGIVSICLLCIAGGIVTEATIFRLAEFDEIDFCCQSLGAVLALTCATAFIPPKRPADSIFDHGLIIGIIALGIGAVYAVA